MMKATILSVGSREGDADIFLPYIASSFRVNDAFLMGPLFSWNLPFNPGSNGSYAVLKYQFLQNVDMPVVGLFLPRSGMQIRPDPRLLRIWTQFFKASSPYSLSCLQWNPEGVERA